jgi:hypothetical protein
VDRNVDYYNQEIKYLPSIKEDKDIFIMEDNIGHDYFREQIKKYSDVARRFLPYTVITNVEQFDVDTDGLNETIISTCGLWGNHCPHEIMIVKNNKIVFSTFADNLMKSNTGNGFYLHWVPSRDTDKKWDTGLCCPPGYMKTRFIFEKGKFNPIYEQEILYIKVEDPLYKK